jgi:hypothetical protein
MSSSSPKIEKLKDDNWLAWKTHMAAVLKRKKAYEVVLGIMPQLSDPSASAIWEEKDAITQELITTAIRDEQVIHVSTCNTAAEMWDALRIIHKPQGQQSIISTKHALYSAQAKKGTDIAAHLNEIKQKCERLTLSGHLIKRDEFKAILVASLPRSWEAWTTSYLGYQGGTQGNQTAQTMTEQQLVSLLCEEETRRKEKGVTGEYAYSVKPTATSQNGKPCTCRICGRTNHNTGDCRFKGKPKCDTCGRFGHKGTECWKNPANRGKGRVSHRDKDKDKGKTISKGKERVNVTKDDSESDTESLDRAFTAHVSVVDDNEANFLCYLWIADSGATTHICAQRNMFQNFKEIPKKEIKGLGDRPVDAYGQGTVIISSRVDNHVVKIHLTDTLYVPDAQENIISLGYIDSIRG